ncbi:MAG: hypothetical protein CLLPBCKN_006348 [Chroococcidiopsis cubana SAG 39.79]|uniref:Uncharacterized protein n=1 Tax=Chroococcidiopsis cubana SAG 39.79 TaxID=388085 RepID=A0AB37UC10_9CYAN|nr:DUF5995 family protein [Chroococcidiopsis cubana]MDZ4876913.1 hypothetical protein [Chroococcidiopsis cubana SAG 39.79]PSB54791.1 hypothetical protein C7B79_34390 [Chroococcidiopsis cubana CCALA 043]RUT03363.1 hypothetical protein DSM107010_60500 [Chroococcidiopsis cubana SAG 39.79]
MKKLSLFLVVALLWLSPGGLTWALAQELTSKKVCKLGKPQCVTLVIQEMERRYEPLAKQCDHDAVFALNYLRTTEVFQQTLGKVNYNNPTAVIREDALFAEYYFRAYDAYHKGEGNVPPVWQITFDAAQNRSVSGSGNLALGINAHIQRDLPFVLYELYLKGRPVSYEDHTRVNDFLQQVNPLKELTGKFDPTIDDQDVPGDEDDRQRFKTIVLWREGAFRNYERLRNASTEAERMQIAKEIEEFAAGNAQFLQQSFSYPPGTDSSERDIYCQEQQRR